MYMNEYDLLFSLKFGFGAFCLSGLVHWLVGNTRRCEHYIVTKDEMERHGSIKHTGALVVGEYGYLL